MKTVIFHDVDLLDAQREVKRIFETPMKEDGRGWSLEVGGVYVAVYLGAIFHRLTLQLDEEMWEKWTTMTPRVYPTPEDLKKGASE